MMQLLIIHPNEVQTDNYFIDIIHDTHINGDPHKRDLCGTHCLCDMGAPLMRVSWLVLIL